MIICWTWGWYGGNLNYCKKIISEHFYVWDWYFRRNVKEAKEKVLDTVTLSLGDAEHLPFENGKFDCLLCTDSFHHYPTPKRAIAEFCRVLDTNGYLILADFWKPFPIRQAMNIFIPFSNEGDVRIYSKSEIINFLEASGFQDIQYRNINKSGYLVIAKK